MRVCLLCIHAHICARTHRDCVCILLRSGFLDIAFCCYSPLIRAHENRTDRPDISCRSATTTPPRQTERGNWQRASRSAAIARLAAPRDRTRWAEEKKYDRNIRKAVQWNGVRRRQAASGMIYRHSRMLHRLHDFSYDSLVPWYCCSWWFACSRHRISAFWGAVWPVWLSARFDGYIRKSEDNSSKYWSLIAV